jgi:tRNA(fMet)-specific endonuclease VapC
MYLLDTTHCLDLIWGFLDEKLNSLDEALISACVISCGELMFGAYKSEQINDNLREVFDFLMDIIVYEIDNETAIIYGKLKNEILEHFGPKDRRKRKGFRVESLGFKDNDLWISASAIQHNLILVSADSDIMRLNGIEGLRVENW